MSPWLIQTFLRNLPRMWASRFSPSKHSASSRPLPSILRTCAYSGDGWRTICEREKIIWEGKYERRSSGSGRTLTFFFKCQFALFVVVFIFATTSIFPSLMCVVSSELQRTTRTDTRLPGIGSRADEFGQIRGRTLTFPLFLGISTSLGCVQSRRMMCRLDSGFCLEV